MFFRSKRRYVVRTLGDETLRAKAAPVIVTEKIRELAAEMVETMRAFDGIGLAAPQVGEPLRLVVLGVPLEAMSPEPSPGELELLPRMPLVLVNPEIVAAAEELDVRDEGCLSVPDLFAPVVRPRTVVLRSETLDGEVIALECGGLLGRCIQHELDHLDGKLFTDRLQPEVRKEVEQDLHRLKLFGARHHYQRVISR